MTTVVKPGYFAELVIVTFRFRKEAHSYKLVKKPPRTKVLSTNPYKKRWSLDRTLRLIGDREKVVNENNVFGESARVLIGVTNFYRYLLTLRFSQSAKDGSEGLAIPYIVYCKGLSS